jgi:hypothetical protein
MECKADHLLNFANNLTVAVPAAPTDRHTVLHTRSSSFCCLEAPALQQPHRVQQWVLAHSVFWLALEGMSLRQGCGCCSHNASRHDMHMEHSLLHLPKSSMWAACSCLLL